MSTCAPLQGRSVPHRGLGGLDTAAHRAHAHTMLQWAASSPPHWSSGIPDAQVLHYTVGPRPPGAPPGAMPPRRHAEAAAPADLVGDILTAARACQHTGHHPTTVGPAYSLLLYVCTCLPAVGPSEPSGLTHLCHWRCSFALLGPLLHWT